MVLPMTAANMSPRWCRYCFNTHFYENQVAECKEIALKVAGQEPHWLPEPVIGWRGFEPDRDLKLHGQLTVWPKAEVGPAKCMRNHETLEFPHASPSPFCACGFHILKEKRMVHPTWTYVAKVEGWGESIEHEDGWRVQYAKILGLDRRSPFGSFLGGLGVYALEKIRLDYGIGGTSEQDR